jgi:hypothetical protein
MSDVVKTPCPETVDFIYQHTREALQGQVGQARNLDAKIAQLFAAGTIVLGLAGTSALAKAPGGVVVAAVVFYGLALVLSAVGIFPMKLRGSDYGETMWLGHWDQSPADIKYAVVTDVAEGSRLNEERLLLKSRLLIGVLVTTGIEAILVGAAVIASRF